MYHLSEKIESSFTPYLDRWFSSSHAIDCGTNDLTDKVGSD